MNTIVADLERVVSDNLINFPFTASVWKTMNPYYFKTTFSNKPTDNSAVHEIELDLRCALDQIKDCASQLNFDNTTKSSLNKLISQNPNIIDTADAIHKILYISDAVFEPQLEELKEQARAIADYVHAFAYRCLGKYNTALHYLTRHKETYQHASTQKAFVNPSINDSKFIDWDSSYGISPNKILIFRKLLVKKSASKAEAFYPNFFGMINSYNFKINLALLHDNYEDAAQVREEFMQNIFGKLPRNSLAVFLAAREIAKHCAVRNIIVNEINGGYQIDAGNISVYLKENSVLKVHCEKKYQSYIFSALSQDGYSLPMPSFRIQMKGPPKDI